MNVFVGLSVFVSVGDFVKESVAQVSVCDLLGVEEEDKDGESERE